MKLEAADLTTTWLLGACLVLTVYILIEWSLPYPLEVDAAAGESGPKPSWSEATVYEHPPRTHYDAILDRPVFFQDRKLPVKVEPVRAEPVRPLRLKLEGVAMVADSRIALLRSLADSRLVHLREGESHDGWRLESISSNGASFTHGDRTTELSLELPGKR